MTLAIDVLAREEHKIEREDDVVLVRRRVRAIATAQSLDSFALAAVTTATSELTRNVLVHGGGGVATIEQLRNGNHLGLRVTFRDQGPGIPDIDRVMKGGYSTARSMGLGLSGSKRLVDELTVDSDVGRGTTVVFIKWKPF